MQKLTTSNVFILNPDDLEVREAARVVAYTGTFPYQVRRYMHWRLICFFEMLSA